MALSTAGAALLRPWVGRGALGFWVGGVLIDVDHYLWFCLRRRRLSPRRAVQLFNGAHAPQAATTRVFHSPIVVLSLFLLGVRRRQLLPVAIGMGLHVALDATHDSLMNEARHAALERDDHACQACGVRGSTVGTHLKCQPWLSPSYGPHNLVSLCDSCHELVHARVQGASCT